MSPPNSQPHELPSHAHSAEALTSRGMPKSPSIDVQFATAATLPPLQEEAEGGVEDDGGLNHPDGDQQVPSPGCVRPLAASPVSTTFDRDVKFFPGSSPFLPFNESLSLLVEGASLAIPRNPESYPLQSIPPHAPQALSKSPLAQSHVPEESPALPLSHRTTDGRSSKNRPKIFPKNLWKGPVKRIKQLLTISRLFKGNAKHGGGGEVKDEGEGKVKHEGDGESRGPEKPTFALRMSLVSDEERCHHRRRTWYLRNNPEEFEKMMEDLGFSPSREEGLSDKAKLTEEVSS